MGEFYFTTNCEHDELNATHNTETMSMIVDREFEFSVAAIIVHANEPDVRITRAPGYTMFAGRETIFVRSLTLILYTLYTEQYT